MKNKSKNSKMNSAKKDSDPLAGDLAAMIAEGGWQGIQFELSEKKSKVLSLRLSEKLYNELKKQARALGLDTQKFIRLSLENAVKKKAG